VCVQAVLWSVLCQCHDNWRGHTVLNCATHSTEQTPSKVYRFAANLKLHFLFLLGILIFKGLTARRLYKSFGVKGLNRFGDTVSETVVRGTNIYQITNNNRRLMPSILINLQSSNFAITVEY
jgi:hypothetical protein